MAKGDSSNTFLSKLAKFVRNPTVDWSELDEKELEPESGYNKETLKEMIERKRQNDFVRKREFDHLRKLRRRDPHPSSDNAGRPSFFQSSLPTNPDERALTLRKIDEIEAQMSRQWWKSKQDEVSPSAAARPALASASSKLPAAASTPDPAPTELPTSASSLNDRRYVSKEALHAPLISEWQNQDLGFEPTQAYPATGAAPKIPERQAPLPPPKKAPLGGEGVTDFSGLAAGAPMAPQFAVELADSMTDPDLEDAAIRFANADYTGAEAGLMAALQGSNLRSDLVESWMMALFDLYRATGQRTRFEKAASDWAKRFGRSAPVWFSIPELLERKKAASLGVAEAAGMNEKSKPTWASPVELSAGDLAPLQAAIERRTGLCVLDWHALKAIMPDAVDGLAQMVARWCDQPLKLEFHGYKSLDRALRRLTPSGDKTVHSNCWLLRLDALRVLKQQDEFELAALEYCVTYEMSPPCWQDARCDCVLSLNEENESGDVDFLQAMNARAGMDPTPVAQAEIAGEIEGDSREMLAEIDEGLGGVKQLVISCEKLIRVDFSAAGSILNWVASHRAKGRHIQFTQVSSIVAAFFNVIGINEQARVVTRNT